MSGNSPDHRSNSSDDVNIDSVIAQYMACVDRGEAIDKEKWIQQYPQIAEGLREFFLAEHAMAQSGRYATKGNLGHRTKKNFLKIRCPHCRSPADIAVDTPVSDILCDSCGGEFTLASDSLETRRASKISSVAHFEMIERLGVGGFGTVWKARDKELDRVVAVKIPRRGGMSDEEMEKFLREARASAQLNHPNIVTVHEVGRDDETIYIVSDFVRGVTLEDWLTGDRPSVREAAKLCRTIALAVEHAHQRGVIHRDLTPGNVMIDGNGEPHLMDFGLARRESADVTLTIDGEVMGTPGYMSPEQAAGLAHSADRRTDVYSLGILLFRLLTGERPFRGNVQMLMYQVLHKPAPSPRKLNDCIPRDLETICLKCLEKKPELRYQSAAEVADELARFLENKPINARPVSVLTKSLRFCGRHRAATFFVTLAAISSVTVAAVLVYMINDSIIKDKVAAEQKLLLQRSMYNESLRTAGNFWSSGRSGSAITLLEDRQRCPQNHREFTWDLMYSYLRRFDQSLTGHTGQVRQVAVSFDGHSIASASDDGTAIIWSFESGEPKFVVSNGSALDNDAEVRVDRVFSVAFSPDGAALATGSQRSVCLWDYRTGKSLAKIPVPFTKRGIHGIAFSPDGSTLVCCVGRSICLWDIDEHYQATQRNQIQPGPELNHVDWSPDGKWVAVAGTDSNVYVYSSKNWTLDRKLTDATNWVWSVDFSPDSQSLAAASADKNLYVWTLKNQSSLSVLSGHSNIVRSVAYSPDGQYLSSCDESMKIRLWDSKTGSALTSVSGHAALVHTVAFSPAGEYFISSSFDKTVKKWRLSTLLKEHSAFDVPPAEVDFAGKANILFFALENGSIAVVDRYQNKITRVFQAHDDGIRSLSCSADGSRLVSLGNDSTIRLWDFSRTRQSSELQLDEKLYHVAVSQDGSLLAIGGDKTVSIVELDSMQVLHRSEAHQNQVIGVAFSSDNRMLATACRDASIGLWDLSSNRIEASLIGHGGDVMHLAFSSDDRKLATASRDRTVRVWDIASRTNTATFYGHQTAVRKVRWSPDDETIVSVGESDGALLFWDVELQQERARIHNSNLPIISFEISSTEAAMFTLFKDNKRWADWSRRYSLEAANADNR